MPFSQLGLSNAAQAALGRVAQELGYLGPTPVQSAAIPAILQGKDVWVSAQTGSGKTAAFLWPLLQKLAEPHPGEPAAHRGKPVKALVLVPTRELAVQIGAAAVSFAQHLQSRVKVAVVFGGVSINPQMMHLRGGADLVVATPGRLIDLMEHNAISLAQVQMLVLDEADRLLELGFAEEISRIVQSLPSARQSLFFSATLAAPIQSLAGQVLNDPLHIAIAPETASAPDIAQRAIEVDAPKRTQLLRHLIQTEKWSRCLVFVATKHAAEIVADKLRKAGIEAEPFHGELSQGKRSQVLQDFKDRSAAAQRVVVATDVASRGLDIALLPVVVNYDLPRSTDDYIHRIGRTARAGASGVAISFVTASNAGHFSLIEKRHRIAVIREQIAGFELTPLDADAPAVSGATDQVIDQAIDVNGGIKGKRVSKKDRLRLAAAAAKSALAA